MIRAIKQIIQACNAACEAYARERAMQKYENVQDDEWRHWLASLTDNELQHYAASAGGSICYQELLRRGLPLPNRLHL